jgi:hypothetical protein
VVLGCGADSGDYGHHLAVVRALGSIDPVQLYLRTWSDNLRESDFPPLAGEG